MSRPPSEDGEVRRQSDLENLVQWSERWQSLPLPNARHYILVILKVRGSKKSIGTHFKIYKEKDLGIVVTSKLSASDQVLEARQEI